MWSVYIFMYLSCLIHSSLLLCLWQWMSESFRSSTCFLVLCVFQREMEDPSHGCQLKVSVCVHYPSGPIRSGTGYTFICIQIIIYPFLNKSVKTTLLLTFDFNTQFLLCFCLIPLHQISVLFAATADVHIPATIVGLLQSAFSLAASKLFHIFCHFIFLGVTILDQVGTLYHSKLDIPSSCSLYILQPMCFHY